MKERDVAEKREKDSSRDPLGPAVTRSDEHDFGIPPDRRLIARHEVTRDVINVSLGRSRKIRGDNRYGGDVHVADTTRLCSASG